MNTKQYTLRGVPDRLDSMAREQAAQYNTSLNALLLEALKRGLGAGEEPSVFHDMDDLAGEWEEDAEFDIALQSQRTVDGNMWK